MQIGFWVIFFVHNFLESTYILSPFFLILSLKKMIGMCFGQHSFSKRLLVGANKLLAYKITWHLRIIQDILLVMGLLQGRKISKLVK